VACFSSRAEKLVEGKKKLKKQVGHYFSLFLAWTINCSHHAEGLVNPKVLAKNPGSDFRYPRACRFRKHQIYNMLPELCLPNKKT
jgi:hypothetical protein